MRLYLAPMEGLTGYIYRNAHHKYFNNIDKYFSPFISPNQSRKLKSRELRDVLPENNQGLVLVPQLLTNSADDFIFTAKKLREMGYGEVNLNLGCPFGTVVSKNKGSGFLARKKELDNFLEEIFSEFSQADLKISIKTRIGKDSPDEFYELMDIYNKYPISELIIHPRIQKDFYKNTPNMNIFRYAASTSRIPVCYNGDIFTFEHYINFISEFPQVGSVMMGRGILANPGLPVRIKTGARLDKKILRQFHDRLYSDYKQVLFGETNVLFKMKGLWSYMVSVFANHDKHARRIKKATSLSEYETAVSSLFEELDITEEYDQVFHK